MQVTVDGKTIDIKPGQAFFSGGKQFGLCPVCARIIRIDGIFKGVHFCK